MKILNIFIFYNYYKKIILTYFITLSFMQYFLRIFFNLRILNLIQIFWSMILILVIRIIRVIGSLCSTTGNLFLFLFLIYCYLDFI